MKAHNISDARALEQYYIRRVLGLVGSAGEVPDCSDHLFEMPQDPVLSVVPQAITDPSLTVGSHSDWAESG
jgi:hypothetical protein